MDGNLSLKVGLANLLLVMETITEIVIPVLLYAIVTGSLQVPVAL